MFDNLSRALFFGGGVVKLMIVPLIRFLGAVFMAISTYKMLKARRDNHMALWLLAVMVSPILARIAYEVYRRCMVKKESPRAKGSGLFLMLAIALFVASFFLSAGSAISMGTGILKSELDGEYIVTFYDARGNAYSDIYDVPLYDEEGNVYIFNADWFTMGGYIDQNGRYFYGESSFLREDGVYYYDEGNTLVPVEASDEYYTDGECRYYYLIDRVFWDENGMIWASSGRWQMKLFELEP